jgi:DNA-binding transcriptional ArsR family regulator
MKQRVVFGLTGLFMIFLVLFGGLSYYQGTAAYQTAPRSDRAEAGIMAADARTTPSPEPSWPWTTIAAVVVLSLASTGLSWTVVDQVQGEDVEVLNLDDEEGKQALQALSNETCLSILNALHGDERTASQIADELDMSIQRVHYNITKLSDAGLVKKQGFKYSEKGREMDLYTVANKYFLIGPPQA